MQKAPRLECAQPCPERVNVLFPAVKVWLFGWSGLAEIGGWRPSRLHFPNAVPQPMLAFTSIS